ncbi:MAG: sigma-70 family RNA polymerase sigma factor [Acidobacteriota bacterium]|nr:sigma-70 family RNA polymerase sigma factor [Acidobacteriota bacterium]
MFLARYERLRGWALHLSANNRAAAEDLLQEAFVQFTLTSPDLQTINNLDAYLFGLLRILHFSQLRRVTHRARLLGTVLDYNAAVLGLRAVDPGDQVSRRDELLRVCHYACARKETSKAGSVLLLRFFLGYYPGEIAALSKSTRSAVEERLRLARAEAKDYLRKPGGLRVVGEAGQVPAVRTDLAKSVDAFLRDVRERVYLSRRGPCLNGEQWAALYGGGGVIECSTLAHLASCPDCLDEVNKLLGLPLLAERHPVDSLGKDTPSGGGSATGGGGAEDLRRRGREGARKVFRHDPSELCVAVNGQVLGSQKVGGARNEQVLHVEQKIEFVEVFSEENVRLLLLVVCDSPPGGPLRQTARLALSDGRSLEAELEFNYPRSFLRVNYDDPRAPGVEPARAGRLGPLRGGETGSAPAAVASASEPESRSRGWQSAFGDGLGVWARLRRRLNWRPWLRPATVTAALSLLLIGSFLLARLRVNTVSAAELLVRSAAAERHIAGDGSAVTHRVLYLEQRDRAGGGPAVRQRIETWHSAARGLTARRVYGEAGAFVIGEQLSDDGTRTVILPGAESSTMREARPPAGELIKAGAFWRLTPSAADFLELAGRAEGANLEERADSYVVRYHPAAGPADVLEVELTLRKADLRGVELRLAVAVAGGVREYRLAESHFERRPAEQVPPSVFESEFAASPEPRPGPEAARGNPAAAQPSAAAGAGSGRVVAAPELEVEVHHLLYRIKADLGEQVSVRRTADDRLRVEALVETDARKKELLSALGPYARHPAVVVELNTPAELQKRRARNPTPPARVFDFEVQDAEGSADSELRRHFARRYGDDEARIGEEISRLSNRLIGHSRRAVQHAAALKRLADTFPSRRSESLDPAAREKLRAMVRDHAQGFRQNVQALRLGLLPFSQAASHSAAGGAAPVTSEAGLARAAARLQQLCRSNDEAVRSALAISSGGQSLDSIKSSRFWASLDEAEKLSLSILRAYEKQDEE